MGSELAARYRLLRDTLGDDHPRTRDAFAARTAELLDEEASQSAGALSLWWLSFVDTDLADTIPLEEQRPGGPSFLGVAIVEAVGFMAATIVARVAGINPGGHVSGFNIPYEAVPEAMRGRLLSYDELRAADLVE